MSKRSSFRSVAEGEGGGAGVMYVHACACMCVRVCVRVCCTHLYFKFNNVCFEKRQRFTEQNAFATDFDTFHVVTQTPLKAPLVRGRGGDCVSADVLFM